MYEHVCWHQQNSLYHLWEQNSIAFDLEIMCPRVTCAFTLSCLRLVLLALNPFTLALNKSTISKHLVVHVCLCVYIYVSEVPITVLVLKMEPENEYTTSSSSLKFEETMTIDQVLRSQKTSNSQDTWSVQRIYLCNRLWTLNGKIFLLPFYCWYFLLANGPTSPMNNLS